MRLPDVAIPVMLISSLAATIGLSCSGQLEAQPTNESPPSNMRAMITYIVDGDTVVVQVGHDEFTLDLYGIDCPEIGQRFGRVAAQYVDANLLGTSLTLSLAQSESTNRIQGRLFDNDGEDIQLRMLSLGLAWTAPYIFDGKLRYQREQHNAKQSRKGLWVETGQVPPWQFEFESNSIAAREPAGRWRSTEDTTTGASAELAEALSSIGYLSGHDEATDRDAGVTLYDSENAQPGLNLVVSGHGHEAMLVDMHGETVHRWRYPWKQVMPDWQHKIRSYGLGHEFWRRAHVFPNGELLAIYGNLGIVKIDKDSTLVWKYVGTCHHQFAIGSDDHIFVLTRTLKPIATIADLGNVVNDSITELGPDGQFVRTINLVDCFKNSEYAHELDRLKLTFDPMHVNSIQLLSGDNGIFREDRALISVRELDLLAVVDLETEQIVWTLSGPWLRQHDPELLDTGRILLFDNLGHDGRSRVLEIEPMTGEIVWSYAPTDPNSFYTADCGLSHRLENGNTLAIESNRGRAIEIDPPGNVVWEYRNPNRAGDQNELVATLLDVVRLPRGFAEGWANGGVVPPK